MNSFREELARRSKTLVGWIDSEEGPNRRDQRKAEQVEGERARSYGSLLTRILELHAAGCTTEEIAKRVLTTEPENAVFRGAMLVEAVLHYALRFPEEENQ